MKPIIGVSAWHHSAPPPWDKVARIIRIEALQSISFASQIKRDWDEIAREAVEGHKHNERTDAARQFNGGE